jgi:hypothetical protein
MTRRPVFLLPADATKEEIAAAAAAVARAMAATEAASLRRVGRDSPREELLNASASDEAACRS